MNILIIDGQGGQLGAQLVKEISARYSEVRITAVGTNATATAAMLKAGAKQAATGENPVVVACRKADVIIGPIGIVVADSMYGEVTPQMAVAVGQADATRILIPMNRCENLIAGVQDVTLSAMLEDVLLKVERIVKN
jgi:putative NADH-flavin reductase